MSIMAPGYLKDGAYYLEDGNVTILVAGTLFKVHRYMLERDESAFVDMFNLNNSSADPGSVSVVPEREGTTDENPIHLPGDTADEFRALLWSLYALPQQITTAMTEGDVIQLSNVVRMAHKYQYKTTEPWARRALLGSFSGQPASSISTSTLVQITEVAVLCNDKDLLDAARLQWKGLIGKKKDLAIAINVMGRLGIRDLEGLAYYRMLFEGKGCWDSDPGLTRDQRIRLLSGYYNLTKASEALTQTPPKFDHHPRCSDTEDCEKDWKMCWEGITALRQFSQIVVHDNMDLMCRLMLAVSVMTALEYKDQAIRPIFALDEFRWSECHHMALDATTRMSKETQENLMSFFEDVA